MDTCENTYISDTLTHFVGRGRPEEEQFGLLLDILKQMKLLSKDHQESLRQIAEGMPDDPSKRLSLDECRPSLSVARSEKLSSNNKYLANVVCFCDIPRECLGIHMKKYSPFGVSFHKDFMVRCGASPVFYIEKNSLNPASQQKLSERFDIEETQLVKMFEQIFIEAADEEPQPSRLMASDFDRIRNFLEFYVFSYCRFFDSSLDGCDIDNVYFEREWRVYSRVAFEVADLSAVIAPKKFQVRIVEAFPQVEFVSAESCGYSV